MTYLGPAAFFPTHLNLEEIMATQVKVPCQSLVVLHKFGFLEPSFGGIDLPAGVKLDLPLWAAEVLSRRKYISVTIPKSYKQGIREILRADPTVVDLSRLGPHFYQSGLHLIALGTKDSEDIADILPEILQERLINIADLYSYTRGYRTSEIDLRTGNLMKEIHMDALEHNLYETSKKGAEELAAWLEN